MHHCLHAGLGQGVCIEGSTAQQVKSTVLHLLAQGGHHARIVNRYALYATSFLSHAYTAEKATCTSSANIVLLAVLSAKTVTLAVLGI